MARLNDFYKAEVAPALMTKFGYKSVMQIPKHRCVPAGTCVTASSAQAFTLHTATSAPTLKASKIR